MGLGPVLRMLLIVGHPAKMPLPIETKNHTAKASEAARTQALDHQNPNTFFKYQSTLKQLDIGACFWNEEADHESHAVEQSMAHHRDTNSPCKLDAAAVAEIEKDPEMIEIYHKVDELNRKIAGRPHEHEHLATERALWYNKAAKKRRAKKQEFIKTWWKRSYDEYVAGNNFEEQDPTNLFNIYRKYMPERDRLHENLFTETPIHSDLGRQCLHDMLNLITSKERVAYYPGELPVDGKCPVCGREMSRFVAFWYNFSTC